MLTLDNLKGIGSIFLFLTFFHSCKNDKAESSHLAKEIYEVSVSKLGKNKYKQLWQLAEDSISNWKLHDLGGWRGDTKTGEARLDTIVCINKNADKMVMANLGRVFSPDAKLDAIGLFYGVKIKGGWYFFSGPTAYIPRDEDSLATPTSFTKLHEIAMDNIFKGYLKKNSEKGKWEINEGFFETV